MSWARINRSQSGIDDIASQPDGMTDFIGCDASPPSDCAVWVSPHRPLYGDRSEHAVHMCTRVRQGKLFHGNRRTVGDVEPMINDHRRSAL